MTDEQAAIIGEHLDGAVEAIADRVTTLAPDADADALVKLADAVGKIVHGPQGGKLTSDGTTTYGGGYRTEQVNVVEERPSAGFGA